MMNTKQTLRRMVRASKPLLLWVLPACGLTCGLWFLFLHRDFTVDDSFIPFRYARIWAESHTLGFNPGERVEGYSSPLMLWLLICAQNIGMPLLASAQTIGRLAWFGLLGVLAYGLHRRHPAQPWVAGLPFLLLAPLEPLALWASSGMETLLFLALFSAAALSWATALDQPSRRHLGWAGGLTVLAALARPEGMLLAVLGGLGLVFIRQAGRARWAWFLLTCLLPLGLLLVLRRQYFGEWLPNTYYAKLHEPLTFELLSAGVDYWWRGVSYPPFLPLYALVLLPAALVVRSVGLCFLAALFAGYCAYLATTGGDWMPAGRLSLLLWPLSLVFLCGLLCPAVARRSAGPVAQRYVLLLQAAALALSMASSLTHPLRLSPPHYRQHWPLLANVLTRDLPQGSLIAINMAGEIPYLMPQHRFLDMLGLNDRILAHQPVRAGEYLFGNAPLPGHVKGDGRYVLSRKPEVILFGDGLYEPPIAVRPRYRSEADLWCSLDFHTQYRLRERTVSLRSGNVQPLFAYFTRLPDSLD